VYLLFKSQKSRCNICEEEMSIHDMEIENIINGALICCRCLHEKIENVSNLDEETSIIDMHFESLHKFCNPRSPPTQDHFVFSPTPMIVTPDLSYVSKAKECVEVESEIDPEEKIQSSWYHRATLFDYNRELYDDGEDTNFEAVEEYWRLKHEKEEEIEDLECDFNAQLVFDHKG
jgi:hypothetical protein